MSPTHSPLLAFLKNQPGVVDSYRSKRSEQRLDLRAKIKLDLRRSGGQLLYATALSVSESGIGFMCREPLEVNERVELRLVADKSSEFQPFEIQHVTPTVGAFKIGAIVR